MVAIFCQSVSKNNLLSASKNNLPKIKKMIPTLEAGDRTLSRIYNRIFDTNDSGLTRIIHRKSAPVRAGFEERLVACHLIKWCFPEAGCLLCQTTTVVFQGHCIMKCPRQMPYVLLLFHRFQLESRPLFFP